MRCQMDGAGPHTDAKLLNKLNKQFNQRGWILKFQPANSPLTNVNDACVFPCMSKAVPAEQGLSNGSIVLQAEELWLTVQVWDDLPLDTIARSFAGNHQIASAIAQCEGGDEFAKQRGGLHFGIRKHTVPFFANETDKAPSGVSPVEDCDDVIGVDANEGLKCSAPHVGGLTLKKHLNQQQEIDVLKKHLPCCRQWTQLAAAELRESDEFADEEWGDFFSEEEDSDEE